MLAAGQSRALPLTQRRYDDTNPEAEEGRFFQSILETVRWLGFEPWKITYSSDNFDKLYELAVELIRRGKAYVCTCDGELGLFLSCPASLSSAKCPVPSSLPAVALACHLERLGRATLTPAAEKIKEDRGGGHGNPVPCVHRETPIEESLREFERMKNGEYKEREICLRMKMDLSSGNPYMWDTVAYRVKLAPHHRTGDKWSE
jgi:glutaminyl-tRNA synthetase